MNIIQSFIMKPIDLFLVNIFSPLNPSHPYLAPGSESETHLENLDHPEEKESSQSISTNNIEECLVPDSNATPETSPDTYIFHDDESLKIAILLTVFSPQNICTILGIAYSFSRWEIPPIIETVILNFENMAVGTTLFFIGVSLWLHPWKGCNYLEVLPSLLIKHVIMPLIALLYCWILKFDSLTAYCCVMLFTMPADYTGIALLSKNSLRANPITFSFFFSQLLGLPCFFIWIAIFNETNIISS